MASAVGSLETRPWLPDGLALGFTSSKTAKHDYPDADMRPDHDRSYDKRVGRVVIVSGTDRDAQLGTFDSEEDAQAWAESHKAELKAVLA